MEYTGCAHYKNIFDEMLISLPLPSFHELISNCIIKRLPQVCVYQLDPSTGSHSYIMYIKRITYGRGVGLKERLIGGSKDRSKMKLVTRPFSDRAWADPSSRRASGLLESPIHNHSMNTIINLMKEANKTSYLTSKSVIGFH